MKNSVQNSVSKIARFCFKNVRRSLVALFVIASVISVAAYSSGSIAGSLGELFFGSAFSGVKSAQKANFETKEDSRDDLSAHALQNGSLTVARKGHTATRLDDGSVLIVGGDAGTFEVFDPVSGVSAKFGNLMIARSFHTATRMADGRVLITGGSDANGAASASTEIYDPSKGRFSRGIEMNALRSGHTATVLPDGRILIIGGDAEGSVEIFDGAAKSSQMIKARLNNARSFHSTALLKNGSLLIVGGRTEDGNPVLSGEILNLEEMIFSDVNRSLHSPRISPVLRELPDGKVQIIGGNDEGSMEIFTPDGNYFSAFAHVIPGRDAKESSALKKSGETGDGINNGSTKPESEVLRTATRAALINNGEASDSLLNRGDYALVKIPESNKVLVFGGKNSEGEILRDTMSFEGSEATITTDQLDYPPHTTVIITGTGFEPNETVQLTLVRDPVFPEDPRGIVFFATADENGNFVNEEYKTTEDDLNTSFVLTAVGLTSGRTAQTTFTDSASTDHFRTVASGNWNATGTWESSPDGVTWTAANLTPTSSANTVTIRNGHTVTVTVGVTVDQVVVNSGGQITNNSGITLVLANGAGTDMEVTGTLRNAGTVTTTGTLVFQSGGKYQHNFTTSNGTIPTATWNTGSTTEIVGYTTNTNATSGLGQSFYNFTWNCPSQTGNINLAGGLTTVNGTFTMTSTGTAEMRLTGTTDFTLNIAGDYSQTGGTLNPANGNNGNATINVTGDFSLTAGSIAQSGGNSNTSAEFFFNKAGTQVFTGGGSVSGSVDFTVNSGSTLDPNTSVITGRGFTLSSGATLNIGSTGGIASSGATGNVQTTNRTFNTAANYTYDGLAVQITGTGVPVAVNTLTINNSSGVTLSQNVAVSSTFALTSGIFTTGANTVTVGNSGNITGGSATSYVNGKLTRTFSATGSKTFPIGKGGNYRPLTFNYTALSGSSSVTAEQFESGFPGTAPAGTAQLGTRYWNVTQVGSGAFTYNITLDGTGTTPTGAVKILKHDSGTTLAFATTVPNYTATGLTSLSDFTLAEETCDAPSISSNPTSQTKNVGEAVTFSVTSSGTATLTYQWRKGGVDILGATSSSYNIPSVVTGDAGSYDVVVTNGCGSATSTAATLTVNKLNQTITFGALADKSFGDPDFAVSATASSSLTVTFAASGNCTVTGTTVHITGAGSCTITASQAGNATYNAAPDVPQSFNIAKATPTITWANPADIIYGTALGATQLNASASVGGGFVYTPAGGTVLNAGNGQNLHVDFTPTDTANYNNASKDVSINVLKATLTVTANNQTVTYGDTDPTFDFVYSGFVNGDLAAAIDTSPTCGVTGAHTNAGTYPIVCSGGADNNYDFSYVNGTLTVNKATLTVTANPQTITYGDADPTFTFLYAGFKYSENAGVIDTAPTCSVSGAHSNAGSYTITCSGGADNNYDFSYVNGTLTVNKAALTATADNQTITYGDPDPAFTFQYSGFVNGELAAVIDTAPTCGVAGAHANAGSYTITCSGGADNNYDFSYVNGTLTVNKANAACTVNGYNVTYDGAPHTATGSCLGVASETLAGLDLSATTHTNAGTYNNDPWTFTDSSGNYNDTSGTVNDSIAKVALMITASSHSVTYGDTAPTITASYSGFIAGESSSNLTTQPICSTTYTQGSPVSGSPYPTNCSGAAALNYEISYTNGSVTVTKANAVCTITGYSATYDGAAHTATGSCLGVASETLAGLDLSATTHTNAGTYSNDPWTFTDVTGNYNDTSGTVNDSIAKANANCSVTGYNVTYDGNPHTATGSCLGVASETLAGLDLSATTHTNAGTYNNDPWTFTDVTGNYNDTSGTVNDSIAKANANCTVTGYNVTYDGASHTATGSCLGVLSETLSGLDLSGTTHTNAGSYNDSWTFTDSTGNYNDTSGNVTDSIAKANAVCTITGYSVTYDGAPHTATGSCLGVQSETLSGLDLSGTTHTNAGSYNDSWTFTDSTGNYNDTSGNVADSIAKVALTITASSHTVTYGDAAPTITASYGGFIAGESSSNLTSQPTCGTTYAAGSGVSGSPYPTSCSGATADNYEISYTNGSVTVSKRSLNITASSHSVTYGDAAPTITPSYAGFFGSDDANSLTTQPVCSTTYTSGSSVGGSPYASSCSGATSDNYEISYTNGTVTVSKANAVCTITGYSVTYDGAPHTASGSCLGVADETLSGLDLSGTTHTNAGTYNNDPWTFTDVTGNYNDTTGTVNDSIAKAAVTATAGSGSSTYDGSPKSPSDCVVSGAYTGNLTCANNPPSVGPGAGTTVIGPVVSGDGQDNFDIASVNGSYAINKADAVCTITGYNVTYDGAAHTASGSCTGVGGDGVLSGLDLSGTTHTNSGGYTDSWTFTDVTGNYNNQSSTVSDNIGKAALMITASSHTVTYGDAAPIISASYSGFVLSENSSNLTTQPTCSSTYTSSSPVSGSPYPTSCSGAAADNYEISYTNGAVTVNSKPASVTANSTSKTYGDTVTFAGTEFTTGGFVNGDGVSSVTLTSSGAAAAASVGAYDIVPSAAVGSGLSNYSISYNNGTLIVNARAATVAANNKSKTYGDDNPPLDATVNGTVNGDVLNYTLATTALKFSAVGGYPIAVTLGSNPNYDVTPTDGTLTINAKTASVTANNKSKTYGDDNPALDATVTGTVNGDVLDYTLSTTAVKFSAVGDYPITVTLGSNPNYDVSKTDGTLSITAKTASVSADHKTKTYGDDNPTLTATVSGTVNGDILNYSLATTAVKFSAVGDYPITVTLGSNPNYDVTPTDNTLSINRKSASVTANNKSKTYGDVNPPLDATVTGTVNGDALDYSLATTAGQFSSVGDYPITVTLGSNPNYDVTPTDGTLSITRKSASVTANSSGKTYGDTVTFAGTEFTTGGFVNGDSVASVTLTSAGAAATATTGSYDIVPSAAVGSGLGNYDIAYNNGTLTVDAKDLTITADNRSKVYGATMTTGAGQTQFTTGVGQLVNGDTVTSVTLSSTGAPAAAAVGSYAIVPSAAVGTGLSNYDITYANGTLDVTKATLTVTADNMSRYYGNANPTFTASYSGFKNGENLGTSGVTGSPSLTTIATGPLGSGVGGYTITAAIGTLASSNYDFSFVNGTLTINPDPTSLTFDNKTSGVNFDCTTNTYTVTLKDTITNQGLSGADLKLSIGTQSATATTNSSGVATFAIVLNQPPGSVTEKAELDPSFTWSSYDTNRTAPPFITRSFTILADPYVGPGINAASLYTGSLYFWTTSSTSSTATLTLSATLRDTFPLCPGDITKAKVTFQISTNGGSSWSNVSNAQNLPVGLVNPNDTSVGTASAISQYNIGSSQSVTLMVRVVVGGHYTYNAAAYDLPITIGKPGLTNSLMGGGQLNNDGSPFYANGYFGLNSINSSFGSQVQYNKKGINPQGQVTVTVLSCNDRFGAMEPGCSGTTPNLWHKYFIKSNSISELSLISGSASFGSKTNVSEVLADGSKIGLDGGNTMQLIFTPQGQAIPQGFFTNVNASYISASGVCNNIGGCASIVIFRSSGIGGGVWYSSSWGQAPGVSAPRTYSKRVVNGSVFVQ